MNIKVYDHIIVMGQCQTKLNMCAVSPVSAESLGVIDDKKVSTNHTK